MSLAPGTRLGAFEIIGLLGAGGMGEVYRARDSKLKREVAIKVLAPDVATDPDRLARFQREAEVLASLNHPHIAQIFGLEQAAEGTALVMELVEGQGLDELIAAAASRQGGGLPLAQALSIAREIADALEAAHDAGIVHRDLKPANIRVRRDATVKVLDFGLAKTLDPAGAPSATITVPAMTAGGLILGTAAYMSPEQARGLPVDRRTDIWSFGCVLYEMLAGRRTFPGEHVTDTLAAVLTRDPDFASLPPETPASIVSLLKRCLDRDVKARLRDIGEARVALAAPGGSSREKSISAVSLPPPGARLRAWPWMLVGASAIVAALLLWRGGPPASTAGGPLLSLGIDAGGDTALAGVGWAGLNWVGPAMAISPDGGTLVFIARGLAGGRWQLYLRRLDELGARALAGTEGAYAPFFSPDGASIGFFSGGRLLTLTLGAGTVETVATVQEARGGSWAPDGSIVYAPAPEGPLLRVPAGGGAPVAVTAIDPTIGETTHRWPQVLPGGTQVLFTAHDDRSATREGAIMVQALAGGTPKVVHKGGLYGRYVPSGHLLFVRDSQLFAAAFDLAALQVTGDAVAVASDVAQSLSNGTARFAASDTGLVIYQRARNPRRIAQWMDFSGQFETIRNVPAEYQEMRFSPDGTRMLMVIADGPQSDVWVYELASDRISRLTFHPDNDWSAIWSPDGRYIAYGSWRADVGTFNLFVHRADGTGEPKRLSTTRSQQLPLEWHPGGRHLLYSEDRRGSGSDLMLLPIDLASGAAAGEAQLLLGTPANEAAGEFSPDGRWLAYTSDESGRSEVYVQPFPGPGGRWQVSTEGAEWVEWYRDLMYGRSEEVVMSVPYRVSGSTFIAEKPRVWMRIPAGVLWLDPAPDSTRAAVIRSEEARRESMVLLVNAFDHFRRVATAR